MGYMYGMPTLIELNSILDNIHLCHALGLEFVELNMNLDYCHPDENDVNKIIKLKEEYNIRFTMHFPDEIDFGSFYEEINEANIKLFHKLCEWGSKIGVEMINIHLNPGAYITLPEKKVWAYERNYDKFKKNYIDSMKQLIKIASKYKMVICIENTVVTDFIYNIYEELIKLDHIYFTYDIGHDAKSQYILRDLFFSIKNKVKHMHLHDYDGITDHQVLFHGNIDLNNRIGFAKKNDISIVVEVKTVESLRKSIDNLRIRRFL